MAEKDSREGTTPRWVWVSGVVAGAVVLLALVLVLLPGDGPLGDHGPDRHDPEIDSPEHPGPDRHDPSQFDHG